MKHEKKSFSFQGPCDLSEVLGHLETVQQGLRAGALYFQSGHEVVGLEPEGTVRLEVGAKSKKNKQTLKIEISWKKESPAEDVPREALRMTLTEPALEVAEEGED